MKMKMFNVFDKVVKDSGCLVYQYIVFVYILFRGGSDCFLWPNAEKQIIQKGLHTFSWDCSS